MKTSLTLALALTLAVPAFAEKPSPEFLGAFERTFAPHRTFGVVAQKGVPTTSVYGVEGKETNAHYSLDIRSEDRWETSQGLLDTAQVAADFLSKGEIMELSSLSYKDNRIDMRFVSVEAHNVTRGGLFKNTQREPVATNFKFFFPFTVASAQDVPKAVAFVSKWIKPYPSEQAARAAARGAGDEPRGGAASGGTPSSGNKEIKVGMTPLQVIDVLGKPQKEVTFQNKTRWTYPDLQVIFENGRVSEVKF